MCFNNPLGIAMFKEKGLCEVIVNVLDRNVANSDIVRLIASLICIITYQNKPIISELVVYGAIKALVAAFTSIQHQHDLRTSIELTGSLCNLLHFSANIAEVDVGLLSKHVIEGWRWHYQDESFARIGSLLLVNLCRNSSFKTELCSLGLLPYLTDAVYRFAFMVPNDIVVEKMLLAIQALLLGNIELGLCLSMDVCSLVVVVLDQYSYNSKIVLAGTSIILLAYYSDCGANLPAVFLSKGYKSVFKRLECISKGDVGNAVLTQQCSGIMNILNHDVAREIAPPFEIH